jgi:hypothetical protein
MVICTLEEQGVLYGSYVKNRSCKSHKRKFDLLIQIFNSSFISDFRLGEEIVFNWVLLRQEIH